MGMQPASPSLEEQWPDLAAAGSAAAQPEAPGAAGRTPPRAAAPAGRRPGRGAAVSAATDLEATARTSGALVRRREIRSAEALLRRAPGPGRGRGARRAGGGAE